MHLVYDPAGWAAPVTLFLKLLMKKTFTGADPWTAPLTDAARKDYIATIAKCRGLASIELPRLVARRQAISQSCTKLTSQSCTQSTSQSCTQATSQLCSK